MPDKAILFGVNRYKTISALRGCINDVHDLADSLSAHCNFSAENIRKILDEKVTLKELQKQWRWLLKGAAPGDRLVFHFSGHGSYVADDDSDEEDGVDEVLCLYDMDWDDGSSYLRDDDLQSMSADIPRGVAVTFLFDSCHSGTATRMIESPGEGGPVEALQQPVVDIEATLARTVATSPTDGGRVARPANSARAIAAALAPRSMADAEHTVLARFAPPPPDVTRRKKSFGVRGPIISLPAASMNHVLFAGSRSDQTSADAFIDGDFHGAFTFYFCDAVRRANGRLSCQEAISRVRERLVGEQFPQIPQLEPEQSTGRLFGDSSAAVATPRPSELAPNSEQERIVSLLERVVMLLERPESALRRRAASHRRDLVFVHGICRHDAGYSDPWWNSLNAHLTSDLRDTLANRRHEVLWSEFVSPVTGRRAVPSPSEQLLADALRGILVDRADRQALNNITEQSPTGEPRAVRLRQERALLGIPGLDCVDDFAKYLLNDAIRDQVITAFLEVVEPLLEEGSDVAIISHSWGTVVAYEGLRQIDQNASAGRVGTLFTVGSALSISLVRDRLRSRDGARPTCVRQWINLDARGDVVGGPLAPHGLAVDHEYLQLAPVGCRSVAGIVSPACAHSSYFERDNSPVNAGVFRTHLDS